MIRIFIVLFFLMLSSSVFAQYVREELPPVNEGSEIQMIDKPAEFEGGIARFYEFVSANIQYPKNPNPGVHKIMVGFVIERDGTLSSIRILRSTEIMYDESVIEVLKNSPKWIPALKDGKAVRTQFTLPMTFNAGDNSEPLKGSTK